MDIVSLHQNMINLDKSDQMLPYSKVIVNVGEDDDGNVISYVAGDDSGIAIEVTCPWGSQAVANAMLARIQGYQYQPYSAQGAMIDPSAEIGDAISSTRVFGGLYSQDITFNKLFASDISAPQDEQIDHEYPYENPTERKITRQRKETKAEFKIVNNAISAEVATRTEEAEEFRGSLEILDRAITAEVQARQTDGTEFRGALELQAQQIEARVTQQGGNQSSFAWRLLSDSFTLLSGNKSVFVCDSSGITVDGTIKARSGYIGTDANGFSIGQKALYNGVTGMTDTSHEGVYVGTDGIRLGKGVFNVDRQGNLTASGTITAKSGYIGNGANGFTIGNTSIRNGMTSLSDTANDGVYIGTDGIALGRGAFKVTRNGELTASGKITATSGFIGNGASGFTIGDTNIKNGRTSLTERTHDGIYLGTDGISLGKGLFVVKSDGSLTAESAKIIGEIQATSGFFGSSKSNGFTINSNGLSSNNKTTIDSGTGVLLTKDSLALGTKFSVDTNGNMTAKGGYIGNGSSGFTIDSKALRNGMTSLADTTNNGVYLGTDGIALGKGRFKVDNQGNLTATGKITATSGYIGNGTSGFEIGNTYLRNGMSSFSDTTNNGVYIGTNGIALGKGAFKVDSAGNLTANNGTFGGTVYAKNISIVGGAITSGQIGEGEIKNGNLGGGSVSGGKIAGGAVSKGKTDNGVQTSLDNGDSAKDTITKLMAGNITASFIYSNYLYAKTQLLVYTGGRFQVFGHNLSFKTARDSSGNTIYVLGYS